MDIDAYHDENEGKWPSIKEIKAQFIPPFVQDQAWGKEDMGNGVFELIKAIPAN
jgi:hypothetical protein